jgi:hypothetical protein
MIVTKIHIKEITKIITFFLVKWFNCKLIRKLISKIESKIRPILEPDRLIRKDAINKYIQPQRVNPLFFKYIYRKITNAPAKVFES